MIQSQIWLFDSISGVFKQSVVTDSFYLKPYTKVADTTAKEMLPYKEEAITFQNGDNTFSGTLTLPFKGGRHPAVVLFGGETLTP